MVVKILVPHLGTLNNRCRYIKDPKRDPNFENHPYKDRDAGGLWTVEPSRFVASTRGFVPHLPTRLMTRCLAEVT